MRRERDESPCPCLFLFHSRTRSQIPPFGRRVGFLIGIWKQQRPILKSKRTWVDDVVICRALEFVQAEVGPDPVHTVFTLRVARVADPVVATRRVTATDDRVVVHVVTVVVLEHGQVMVTGSFPRLVDLQCDFRWPRRMQLEVDAIQFLDQCIVDEQFQPVANVY